MILRVEADHHGHGRRVSMAAGARHLRQLTRQLQVAGFQPTDRLFAPTIVFDPAALVALAEFDLGPREARPAAERF